MGLVMKGGIESKVKSTITNNLNTKIANNLNTKIKGSERGRPLHTFPL